MTLGFTVLPTGDVGENIRYLPGSRVVITGAAPYVAVTPAETVIYTPTVKTIAKAAETITWAGAHATVALAIADWNSQALYTEAYESNAAGVETTGGGYFSIRSRGENFGTGATINITATDSTPTLPTGSVSGAATDLNGTNFKWSIDLNPKQYDVSFVADEDDGSTSFQQVLDKVNAETPGVAQADDTSPPFLKMESNKVGEASEMEILDGSANALLGFTDDTTTVGNGRPAPDLAIDISGDVVLQGQLLRDGLTGLPFNPGFAPALVAYKGLRLDLSSRGSGWSHQHRQSWRSDGLPLPHQRSVCDGLGDWCSRGFGRCAERDSCGLRPLRRVPGERGSLWPCSGKPRPCRSPDVLDACWCDVGAGTEG
jgi:hypothetical protein